MMDYRKRFSSLDTSSKKDFLPETRSPRRKK